jgi:Region found in RelA / SpoT proteins
MGSIGRIEEWRASFSFPMRATYLILRNAALRIDHRVIVSRRLKRMESILAKLERGVGEHGKLSTIQDIAGCRVVFPLIDHIGAFSNTNRNIWENENFSVRNNYIVNPKEDGYRSIHAILRYKANNPRYAEWDGRKIEIQIRTHAQHSWATALEAVDLFSNQKLKWGKGEPKWQRFFTLASAVFAKYEGTPGVPNTPKDADTLREEIRALWVELDVLHKLAGWSRAVSSAEQVLSQRLAPPLAQPATTFLVVMDINRRELRITPYSNEEVDFANEDYANQEQQIRDGYEAYAVLVSVEDVKMLRVSGVKYSFRLTTT